MNESAVNIEGSVIAGLKEETPALGAGLLMEGQLKERSEGVQAQWQTALGVVMAAGSCSSESS